jgi:hypothetical protein
MTEWLIAGGFVALLMGGAVWFAFTSMKRTLSELNSEPEEIPDEGFTTGRLIDPDLAQFIGTQTWGRAERCRYRERDYEGPISCLTCGKSILPGQFFWETPLFDPKDGSATGRSFQICLSCQPGDVEAVIQGA